MYLKRDSSFIEERLLFCQSKCLVVIFFLMRLSTARELLIKWGSLIPGTTTFQNVCSFDLHYFSASVNIVSFATVQGIQHMTVMVHISSSFM